MKRIVSSLVLIAFVATVSHAQQFRFGVNAGIDAARFSIANASGGPLKYKNDVAGGISGEAVISKMFSVQLEANYSRQGAGVIDGTGSTAGSYNLDYLTVPLLAKLYGTPKLSFYAGPQIGFLMSAKVKSSTSATQDVKKQLESTDFYAVFGSEYKFDNGVFVGARYSTGLTNIVKDKTSNSSIENHYLSFRVGYSFAL